MQIRNWKTCSKLLIIQEMQIKTTMRYHLIPVRMAIINKSTNHKCWIECGEKGILVHCWWECRLVQPLWKTVWSFLKKLKMELPFDPVIPLLGIYPRNQKHQSERLYSSLCSLQHNLPQRRSGKCPSADEWIRKLWYIYTMEYYAAVKKKELLPFAMAWMELESIMLSEISQSMKEKYHMISLIHG
uniref:DUF1725 domain-containing protein n=1 Tax=Myotis myotis TaxID=51298 RepID=A0A7J7VI82_MYOMY|nr:hypothetical protein mMyoMyo1_008289 [Myotis myotis]